MYKEHKRIYGVDSVRKITYILLILIFCPTLASNYTFIKYSVIIDVFGEINERNEITIKNNGNEPIKEFSLDISGDIEIKNCSSDYILTKRRGISHVTILFSKPLLFNEKGTVKIDYKINDLVTRVDDKFILSTNFAPVVPIYNFSLLVQLPPGYGLVSSMPQTLITGRSPVVPVPDTLYTDGQRILLKWERNSLKYPFYVTVIFKEVLSGKKEGVIDRGIKGFSLGFVFLALLVGIGVGYFVGIKRGKVKLDLEEEGLKIIEEIEKAGGDILQEELPKLTGFSRPKISRLISDLVEKGIIEKEEYKRTYRLKLKKKP
ncbi:MAG: helix-turn-helix transcriptional regulator [Candidatus Hydrothermarchaeota archaeon]